MATKKSLITFVPKVSGDVPWEIRQHIELLYQKLNNHTQAFANIASAATGITNNTTIQNITQGTGGGGGTPIMGLGGVNNQSGVTSYTTTVADNGVLLILNDASPVAVTLSAGVSAPWMIFSTNEGAGVVTFTPTMGTINGGATFTLPFDFTTMIVFDGTNWFATVFPVVPQNTPAVAGEYLTGYNSSTGAFTVSTPPGISVVYVTAALTLGGTQGSLTFTGGILTAQVPAT